MINLKLSNIYKKKILDLINEIDSEKINKFCQIIKKTSLKKKNIYIFGNGGSASTANHFANDMTKNAKIKTFSFSNDNLITCYSNDYGFKNWIKKTIEHYVKPGDLVIFVSASGNSENVVKAIETANAMKVNTLAICGFDGGRLKKISNNSVWIRSNDMQLCEDAHTVFGHIVMKSLCGESLFV